MLGRDAGGLVICAVGLVLVKVKKLCLYVQLVKNGHLGAALASMSPGLPAAGVSRRKSRGLETRVRLPPRILSGGGAEVISSPV